MPRLTGATVAVILAWCGPSIAQTGGVTITAADGHAATLTLPALQALPSATASLKGSNGADIAFAGPTLWSVLGSAGAIDPDVHHHVRQVVIATGRDGYAATLALGEIDPEFEGKAVVLALDAAGGTLRIVVPGDKRLARDVRDVVSLTVR